MKYRNALQNFLFVLLAVLAFVSLPAFSGEAFAYKGGTVTDGGSVSGKLIFKGKAPKVEKFKVTKNHEVCGQYKNSEELIVAADGAIKNGIVYIKKIKKGKPLKKSTIHINQEKCVYAPHVQAGVKGGKIELINSDSILHNIHAVLKKAIVFNIAMPMKGQKIKQKLRQSGLITITCDAGHTWMKSYVRVFTHPYYAVTGSDGSFVIDDIPPGSYKLVAWHEKLGKKTAELTVTAKGKATVDFTFQ